MPGDHGPGVSHERRRLRVEYRRQGAKLGERVTLTDSVQRRRADLDGEPCAPRVIPQKDRLRALDIGLYVTPFDGGEHALGAHQTTKLVQKHEARRRLRQSRPQPLSIAPAIELSIE